MVSNIIKKFVLVLILTLPFYSCSTMMQTYSYKDKKADLKQYRTYAWANLDYYAEENKKGNKVYARFILDKANAELTKKGFVLDVENPDALFLFDTQIEDRISYSQTPSVSVGVGFGGQGYYVGGAVPVAGGDLIQENYFEGILLIGMYDAKSNSLLWKGWAEEEVSYTTNFEEDISRAVKHIFMRLPVTHKTK
jgi:hypothetical protein